jgi:tripartite-type tricarboxylate transporter receptor subunit TctC
VNSGARRRARLIAAGAIGLAALAATQLVSAANGRGDPEYPGKPIRLLTPSSPGSGVDIVARVLANKLTQQLGQQVIVDNRSGAGGNLGAEMAAKAAADGYTLFIATPAHAINTTLYSKLNYDLIRDFAPVSLVTTGQYIVVVHPALPAGSLPQLVALARAKPGTLSYASGGEGNATHLVAELFSTMAGIKMLHIPYKGAGPVLTDLIGGQVNLTFANLTAALPFVKSARLRALAVTGEQRSPLLPGVPTVAESLLPDFVVKSYYATFVPAGTPNALISRLNAETVKAMRSPEVLERLTSEGADPASGTPQQLAAFIKAEIERWAKVVKAANIRAD